MDEFEAYIVLKRMVDANDDEQAKEALKVFSQSLSPFPPTALGRATNEAHYLADQLSKTGRYSQWRTPPHHSEAMERLIYRVTRFLEALMNLLEDDTNNEVTS